MVRREARDAMQGKSVIVTGASRGIGFATARAFLNAGARVAICARDPGRLRKAEAHLRAGQRLLPSMLARHDGVIVNVSSGAGLAGFPEIVSYCAAKFGVVGFTEALDEEVRGYDRMTRAAAGKYQGEKNPFTRSPVGRYPSRVSLVPHPGAPAIVGYSGAICYHCRP